MKNIESRKSWLKQQFNIGIDLGIYFILVIQAIDKTERSVDNIILLPLYGDKSVLRH